MSEEPPIRSRRAERRARRATRGRSGGALGRLLMALAGAGLVGLVIGFVQFAETVRLPSATTPASADGIVVFTGGQDRIAGAIQLLSDGLAKRLLISGVHPSTTQSAIASLSGGREDLFRCCIDLGRDARDTIGNANETASWARERGFSSLIIVTSNYHMPRSLTELGRAMPGARLEGHPIATPSLDLEHWWRKPEAAALLLSEYVKLLAARLRVAIADAPQHDDVHAAANSSL